MSGMLVEDLTADERSSRFLFPSARIIYVWNGDCSIGLGPWWTRMGRTLQPLIQILIDMWHEWEINHCCLEPLRFGGYLLLQYTLAYTDQYTEKQFSSSSGSHWDSNVYLLQAWEYKHPSIVLCYGSWGYNRLWTIRGTPASFWEMAIIMTTQPWKETAMKDCIYW